MRRPAADYAGWLQALAGQTQIQVVAELARRRAPASVSEIATAVGLGPAEVSGHLAALAEAGVVRAVPDGYRVGDPVTELVRLLSGRAAARPGGPQAGHGDDGTAAPAHPGGAQAGHGDDGVAAPERARGQRAGPAGDVVLTTMQARHAEAVLGIYQAGIDEGQATFETSAPSWDAFNASRLAEHRFVALDPAGRVLGWTAVSAVSDRCVYAGVVEHSVYVAPDARGRGLGGLLLRALIASTEAAGIWTIQSGVFQENAASLALHWRHGFRSVGIRERLGRHHGRWRDVVLIERRSPAVG